jgi:hypothetical protein
MAELSDEQKRRLAVILALMAEGPEGRRYLQAIAPVLQMMDQNAAEDKARKEQRTARNNAILGQLGAVAGNVGGLVLANQLINGGTAAAAKTGANLGTGAGATGLEVLAEIGGSEAAPVPKLLGGPDILSSGTPTGAESAGVGSYALPIAVALAQMNNVYEGGFKDIVRGRGDRSDWTNDLLNRTPQGAAINMGLRLFGKPSLGRMMTSGKSEAEQIRDDFRGQLKEKGIADKDYMITLADGSKYNVGFGGKHQLENVGENIDGRKTRNTWDVDWSNPLAKYATDKIEPIVRKLYGSDDPKKKYFPGQFTGMLVNAATSNAKSEEEVEANIRAILGDKMDFLETGRPAGTQTPSVAPTATPTPTPTPTATTGAPTIGEQKQSAYFDASSTKPDISMLMKDSPSFMNNSRSGLLSLQTTPTPDLGLTPPKTPPVAAPAPVTPPVPGSQPNTPPQQPPPAVLPPSSPTLLEQQRQGQGLLGVQPWMGGNTQGKGLFELLNFLSQSGVKVNPV